MKKIPASILERLPPGERARARGYRDLEDAFALQVVGEGLPAPEREHIFAPPRKWAFDFAWPSAMVAVEVHGGVKMMGRHQRPKGFSDDCLKMATAASRGWLVLPLSPDMLASGLGVELVRQALRWRRLIGSRDSRGPHDHIVSALAEERERERTA